LLIKILNKSWWKKILIIEILMVNIKRAMVKVYVIGNFKDATQITINKFKHEMLPI
jgi:capsular polysaccharide biosynthesis protein